MPLRDHFRSPVNDSPALVGRGPRPMAGGACSRLTDDPAGRMADQDEYEVRIYDAATRPAVGSRDRTG